MAFSTTCLVVEACCSMKARVPEEVATGKVAAQSETQSEPAHGPVNDRATLRLGNRVRRVAPGRGVSEAERKAAEAAADRDKLEVNAWIRSVLFGSLGYYGAAN